MQHWKNHVKVIRLFVFLLTGICFAAYPVTSESGWMSWGPWTAQCPRKCNEEVGYQSRTRICQICVGDQCVQVKGGASCPGGGDKEEFRTCYESKCKGKGNYIGSWTAWQRITDCKPIGEPCKDFQKVRLGLLTYKRSCADPAGKNRRILCTDVTGNGNRKRDNCTVPCPARDGKWGAWGRWSRCSVTCGKGSYTRKRVCNNPPPMGKGRMCPGNEKTTMPCARGPRCPVDGGWGAWSDWSCTVTCGKGGGTGTRERNCDNPPPELENNGSPCRGPAKEVTKSCNDFVCPSVGDLTISMLSPKIKAKIWSDLQTRAVTYIKRVGENLQIQCPMDLLELIRKDFSSTTLIWLRNGKPLKMDPERVINYNGQLMFSTLNPEDNGVYFCKAEYEPPMSQTIGVSTVVVKSDKPTLEAKEESSLKLSCNAEHLTDLLTKVSRDWYQNDEQFNPRSTAGGDLDYEEDEADARVKAEGDLLVFTRVVPADDGTWECRVTDVTTKRTWVTNWQRLKVLPPASGWEQFSGNPKYFGSVIGLSIGVILVVCLVCVCRSKPQGDEAEEAVEKMRLLGEQEKGNTDSEYSSSTDDESEYER